MIVPNDVLAPRSCLSLNNVTFSRRPTLSFLFLFGILPLWDAEAIEEAMGLDFLGVSTWSNFVKAFNYCRERYLFYKLTPHICISSCVE